jgi:hypothetical protein
MGLIASRLYTYLFGQLVNNNFLYNFLALCFIELK